MSTEASVSTTWKHPDRVRPAALPGAARLGAALDRYQRTRPLALPPAGSELKPVPGNKGFPLVGSTFSFMFSGPDFSRRAYDRYGPVTWIKSLGLDLLMALGPDATQAVLVNADKAYSQSGWEWFIGPFFRRGLMLLDFDEHLLHRRIMQEAFTRPRLTGYLERTDELVSKDVAGWPREGQMFAYPTLKRLSLDIATHIFMGDSTGEDDAKLQTAFIDTVRAGTSVIRADVPGLRWHRGLVGRKVLEEYFRAKLPAKRATETEDLFSALCHVETDTGQTFSDDDVVNHMIFLMMAAHDTSTITTSAVLAALAAHPEWQEKAREQSLALDELTIDALDELTVLDLVIKEALRLTAPVPSMVRKTVKDTELLGHYVPADTFVSVSPWFTHYMHEYWTNPEQFDPERFAEPRSEDKVHRYAWVPFGGGAHKCIGMYFGTQEVKILVHHLLRRYRWTTPAGYVVPWDLLSLPMPADGLPLELHPLS
ncbi:MAG TPA: cytochrome P450 [Mycobacteriales bacterium]|nr:cytochrome P450 [Mycobacteriales bacterium]